VQFYVIGDIRTDDPIYDADVHAMKPQHLGEGRRCQICNEPVNSLPWLPPYHAEIAVHGSKLGDYVKVSGTSALVSDRFRLAWAAEVLRGIDEFSPLARLRIRPARLGRRPLTYFHVTAQYWGTQVDFKRSVFDYTRGGTCHHCHSGIIETVRGLFIDESSWTGEDIFMAWGKPGSIIVTDRVRQMRDKHGLTNMNMTPVEEFFWDPLKQWTPYDHSPPYWGYTPPEAPEIDPSATN